MNDHDLNDHDLPVSVFQSAMRGIACRCPRCGRGKLYQGFLKLRPSCERCGLDYTFIDAGDGPAVFIILIALTVNFIGDGLRDALDPRQTRQRR